MRNIILEYYIMLYEKGYRYLCHVFPKKNLEGILSHNMLYNEHDRYNQQIQVDGAYSITTFNFNKPWVVWPGQYPGLYMSLTNELPILQKNEYALLFPTELLYHQTGWHFNLFDRNGTFGYDTYTHENIDTVPDFHSVKTFYMEKVGRYYNEVVFHHSIDLRNCQFLYDGTDVHPILNYGIEHQLIANHTPGIFLYYSDLYYSGMEVPYYSYPEKATTSVEFYKEYCKKYISDLELINKVELEKTKKDIEHLIEPYLIELYK